MFLSSWANTASGSSRSDLTFASRFITSLVPIAIAYHLSHYLADLLMSGQMIIPLLSDPFGYGWELFGTAISKPE